jgi:hypothetical protein
MKNRDAASMLSTLASVRLTLFCVLLAMALVAAGTLAQVHLGTFQAQKEYFDSWWVCVDWADWKVPVFPGGLTIGTLWLINLVASFITRFRWSAKDIGIYLTHAGIILLLFGQLLTQSQARESQLPLQIGQSSNYSESLRATELVVSKISDPEFNEVTSVPDSTFLKEGEIQLPRHPFHLVIRRAYRNASLSMAPADAVSLANRGIGTRIAVQEAPPVSSDEEANNVTAFVEVHDGARSHGIWLISSGLGAPQTFSINGAEYQMAIRPRRYYYPFTLTLKEFHHDIYPGTDIPKNFSSLVHISDPVHHDDREALIYMNHPLRYQGNTFYQASFGEGDRLSVFQVVRNPAAITPYLSCAIVAVGLLVQFLSHLIGFTRRRHGAA